MRIVLTAAMPSMALPLNGIGKASFPNACQITLLICSPVHGFGSGSGGRHV